MSGQRLAWVRDESGAAGARGGVVTLTLSQPGRPVIVLDWDLLRSIDAALDEIGTRLGGFVLASDSRVFIAGANLKEIMGLSDGELGEYLSFGQRVYGRIAALPCTSVAAINGATLGGGLEIAMHCDRLIAAMPSGTPDKPARPYQVGLPEAGLSICPGWGGTNMLPARMDAARAIEATATGKTFTVTEAREAGLIEELLDDPGALLSRARAFAAEARIVARKTPRSIADAQWKASGRSGLEKIEKALPATGSARAVAACVRAGLERGWEAALEEERRSLIRLRGTPEGRAAIEAFFARGGTR